MTKESVVQVDEVLMGQVRETNLVRKESKCESK